MKRFFATLGFIVIQLFASSQTQEDEFRYSTLDKFSDHTLEINQAFAYIDSLATKQSKVYAAKLDSLVMDSVNGVFMTPIVEFSKHIFYKATGKNDLALTALKKTQSHLEITDPSDKYITGLNEYAANYFESNGEPSFALISRKRLAVASDQQIEELTNELSFTKDSLINEVEKKKAEYNSLQNHSRREQKLYLQAIAGAGILILFLLVTLFISRWKLKKKLRSTLQKKSDTNENEILNARLTELSNDLAQYKHTAQLTINKLNAMDSSHRKIQASILKMKDELKKSLDELNTQNEQQKATTSPAIYMSVRNAVTRISAGLDERTEQIIDSLK